MISTQLNTRFVSQATLLTLIFAITTAATFAGPGASSGGSLSGIADREFNRRLQRTHEAEDSITKGDKYYVDGDYEQALNEYKTALDILPEAPATQLLRDSATARYCDAAVGLARQRAGGGRYADARTLLKDALARNSEHVAAKILFKQLDDPDRHNQALTPEHVKNVADVNQHLKMAISYEELGDHDNSIKEFQDVLRIDRYNNAARQGMERVEQEKARYYASSRDYTRSKMLNDVNKGWEEQVPVKLLQTEMTNISNTTNSGRYLVEKMNRIVFPFVQFTGNSVEECIEVLRIKSKDLDTMERDPAKRGVNIILRQGAAPPTASISFELRDAPMAEILRYITELATMKYKVEPYAVLVVPLSETTNEKFTRTFKVPPDFLTGGAGDGGGAAAAPTAVPDPFAPKPVGGAAGGSALPTRGKASEILAANGITFPEGTSATFIAATSQLIVTNTQPNLDNVELFVDQLLKKIPQMINISAKFVEVSQKNTDELGFDWLIGAFNLGAPGVFGAGGTTGTSANGPVNGNDYPFVFPGSTTPVGVFPVTAGNRSGSAANVPNSIDGQILGTGNQAVSKAPGIFSISGVFTDPQFQVVIRALSQKKGVDLMSAPSVTTRSGQKASVEVVREFIYPTEFSPPQIPQNVVGGGGANGVGNGGGGQAAAPIAAPSNPSAFTMRPVGVKMEVEPVIGPDGYTIDLNIAPEVTEFDGFINYGSPIKSTATDLLGRTTEIVLSDNKIQQPIFSTRKVQTAVTVWDGQTVAMGGLIREDVQDVQDKVPILGDLPLIGRLFQTKSQDHFKRNLMVFVTAKLIDPSGNPIRNTSGSTTTTTSGGGTGVEGVSAIPGAPGVLPPIK